MTRVEFSVTLSLTMSVFFLILRCVRLVVFVRYFPRLLDYLLRGRVPHPLVRRPLVWWLVRRLLVR